MQHLFAVAVHLDFADLRLRVGHLMTELAGLWSDGSLLDGAVSGGGLHAADLVQINDLEFLVFRQGSGIPAAASRLHPFGGVAACEVGGFTLGQLMIEDVVAMEVHMPPVRMAVGDFLRTDVADLMRAAEEIFNAAMAAGLPPDLTRHIDHFFQGVLTLVAHGKRAEHDAPAVFLAMLHHCGNVIQAGRLNLVVAHRAHPHAAAAAQTGEAAAVLGVVVEPYAGLLADRTAARCHAGALEHTAHRAALTPAVGAKPVVIPDIRGLLRVKRAMFGRITRHAIKGGGAARMKRLVLHEGVDEGERFAV